MSVSSDEVAGNGHSAMCLVSDGGRYVVFHSNANNLVPGYGPGVFMRDTLLGVTTCVSVATSGAAANDTCSPLDMTPDGRYVLLFTRASNLAPDVNSAFDLYVRDTIAGTTTRASLMPGGISSPNSVHNYASISDDGRLVAFSLPVPAAYGQAWNVYVRDMQTQVTSVVWDTRNDIFHMTSRAPTISGNGRYVAFESDVAIIPGDSSVPGSYTDIYVRDLTTGAVRIASASTSGVWGNGHSSTPCISSDGRYVVFLSEASNLVPGDTNGIADVFLRDMATGLTVRINVGNGGEQGNDAVIQPGISGDGRFVSFSSRASNLVPGDTNASNDAFVRDWMAQTTTRVSVKPNGAQADGTSGDVSISRDGGFVAYMSTSTNLVAGDTNGVMDVFAGAWSANQVVYRFFNVPNGSHFYTPTAEERDTVIARWPNIFRYEGVAYIASPANNATEMHRFFNRRAGSHFYTANPDEAASVISNLGSVYEYEGRTYAVNRAPVENGIAVHRFYNTRNGTHFYTSDPGEKEHVETNLRSTYTYDGAAYWVGQ